MKTELYTPEDSVSMTPSAISHIRKEIAKQPDTLGIRIYLDTSGCSGYMYETELVSTSGDTAPKSGEKVLPQSDISLYVAEKDLPILNGTEVDFVTQGLNSMFKFNNPNATAECGCGESFSVESE